MGSPTNAIGKGFWIGLGSLLALLTVNAAITYRNTRRLNDDAAQVAHTHQVLEGLDNVLSSMKDAEVGQRGFIITNDESYLAPHEAAMAVVYDEVDRIAELTQDNQAQRERAAAARVTIEARLAALERNIDLRRSAGFEASRDFILTHQGRRLMDQLRSQIGEMREVEEKLLVERAAETQRTYQVAIGSGVLTWLVSLVTVVALGYLLSQTLHDRQRAIDGAVDQSEQFQTTLASIGDAVITTDNAGRVTYLNAVASALTGWTASEARGEPLERVFPIVNERTREVVENPVTKALRSGSVVGLANHTVLLAKDGTQRPIDDSAAPIRSTTGAITGVVLVFRDVTDRRSAEIARDEQARLTALRADTSGALALSESMHDGLQRAAEALVQHLNVAFARVWTLAPQASVLELQASAGIYTHLDGPHGRVKVGDFKIGRIAANRQPLLTNTVADDPNISDHAWAKQEGMIAFAGYPLLIDQRVVGVVAMFARHPLSPTVLTELAPLAESIAQYIDRKQAEDALSQSEQLYRTLTEVSPQAVWLGHSNGDVKFVNQHWQDYTGLSLKESEGRGWVQAIDPRERERVGKVWQQAMEQGTGYEIEIPFRRAADGHFRWHLAKGSPIRGDRGEVVQWIGTAIDIHDRKLSEEAMRRRSEQLQGLAEIATHLNVAHDVRSILGVVTEGARSVIGAHQSITCETTGGDWSKAISAISLSEKYAEWRLPETKSDGSGILSVVCDENRVLRLTQAELEVHPGWKVFGSANDDPPPMRGWLAAPLMSLDGRNIGIVQLSDKYEGDFTPDDEAILVQLARMASVAIENARLYRELRQGDQRKDEFLATLAHELRNPLAPIQNGLEIMRLAGNAGEVAAEAREVMERQLQQMVRLIDDLLDISRITRGKLELRREQVDLTNVVRNAVETSRSLIAQAEHELVVSLPEEPILVDGDTTRLSQVFANLLNNAAKYTQHSGKIRLEATTEAGQAVIRIQDTGIGIPADMLPKIFDMFVQVDHSLERAQGGLGIGLTLVKRILEMHRGTIEAFSPGEGQGSEFVVRLPLLVSGMPSVDNVTPEGRAKPAQRRRVLVVDDNRDSATSLSMMLKIIGYDTEIAHDGLQAIEAVASFRPDVVLLDIGMPRMNGYEAARRIREMHGQAISLVALTGWGQAEDRRRSQDAGFDHHLVKPVDPTTLEYLLSKPRPAN